MQLAYGGTRVRCNSRTVQLASVARIVLLLPQYENVAHSLSLCSSIRVSIAAIRASTRLCPSMASLAALLSADDCRCIDAQSLSFVGLAT